MYREDLKIYKKVSLNSDLIELGMLFVSLLFDKFL